MQTMPEPLTTCAEGVSIFWATATMVPSRTYTSPTARSGRAGSIGTAVVMPQQLLGQQAPRTAGILGSSLPARGELLIRGATVLTMRDMGVRGRFAYGTPVGMSDDAPMDFAGLARVKKDWMPDKENLLTLGICSRNLGALTIGGVAAATSRGVLTVEQIKRDWDGARALGLPITMHTSGASPIMELERAGLLGPDVQLVHPLLTTPEERAMLKARGVSYSTSPQLEARRSSQLGVIQLGELLEAGVKVSLSTDHIASISCDPFSSMRILFALHSHRIGGKAPLTLKRLLQLATIDGAVDLGIAERTGSITPGKRADLVLVRATDINMAPAGDPMKRSS